MSYTTVQNQISQKLEQVDVASSVNFGTTVLAPVMEDCMVEFATYSPHVVRVTYQLESRTGKATADTSTALVDTTNSQFASTDVGKVIHNTTDDTWGVVTAYTSTSQITLSWDMFPDGNESYEMFNEGCYNNRQFNIQDIKDYIKIRYIEHQGRERDIDAIEGDIVTIGMDVDPPDSSDGENDVRVDVYFAKRHFITQLTDVAGKADDSAWAAGAESMVIDNLQSSGTILAGQEFTVTKVRGVYTVTADATISSNEATVTFWPPLESAVAEDTDITFVSTTLSTEEEKVFVELCAAVAMEGRAGWSSQNMIVSGNQPFQAGMDWSARKYARLGRKLRGLALKSQRMTRNDNPRTYV